ncbi:MAG TPA: putative phage abortive infection protein [Rhodothermales bacterium]|nr:putative phage abortive infection protein [Rhodothermales bacterium]
MKYIRRINRFFIISVILISVIYFIFISIKFKLSDTISSAADARFGDYVGGYIGTIFAFISILLLLENLRNQRGSDIKQAFENKYFTMIELHRKNVEEMELGEAKGRKVFVLLTREWREIMKEMRAIMARSSCFLNQRDFIEISYLCLFFGTGPNSSRMLRSYLSGFDKIFINELVNRLSSRRLKNSVNKRRKLGYTPFEGHQSRLGHYYRHLYQAISYIDEQDHDLDKYEYAKTIRAQLSTHEQALLLLNSLTLLGWPWWLNGFMSEYMMIRNIPEHFFDEDTELYLKILYKESGIYFEWQTIDPRIY